MKFLKEQGYELRYPIRALAGTNEETHKMCIRDSVTVAAHTPRAMPAETLAEHIRAYGCRAEAAAAIEAGVARAVELGGEGPVCALGTLYFSGDVRNAFAELVKG